MALPSRTHAAASWLLVAVVFAFVVGATTTADSEVANGGKAEGPFFTHEPPNLVEFSNTTGTRVECRARGNPKPEIKWTLSDGSALAGAVGLRQVGPDGTLSFTPFKADQFRQDVHTVAYRCSASNSHGAIVSRDVRVRGVVLQPVEVSVYNNYVIKGNTAVFKCHIPNFLQDFVRVTSWVIGEHFVVNKTDLTKIADAASIRYVVSDDGDLFVRNVEPNDAKHEFRCRIFHSLTNQSRVSTPGKLFVTEPWTNVAPRVTLQKAEVVVGVGETALIPCAVEGHPVPSVEWFVKDDAGHQATVSGREQFRVIPEGLLIERISKEDSRAFICATSNELGSAKAETNVVVKGPLQVSIEPSTLIADVNKPASLQCKVDGYPVTSVVWLKDGNLLTADDSMHITDNVVHITNVKVTHKGMFQCFVRNTFTTAQASVQLQLGDTPPELTEKFHEQTIQPGVALSLRCIANGSPPPEVMWTRDGHLISNHKVHNRSLESGTASWLNISRVRTEEGGVYSCTGRNKAGVVNHEARINVYGHLAARSRPTLSIVAGNDVYLNCPYTGFPIKSIQWEKDGAMLPNDFQQLMANNTLFIHQVERSTDQGKYQCVVRNHQDQQISSHVDLKVLVPPKIVPFTFQDDQFFKGMRAHIICAVSQGDLPLHFQWLKDGQSISQNFGIITRNIDGHANSLSIESVSSTHSGNYTCVVSNEAATMAHTAQLLVYGNFFTRCFR